MIQRAQKEVFSHFWNFGLLDQLDIANHGAEKACTLFSYAGSFKKQKNAFLNDPKSQKWGFWPFSELRSVGLT